MSGASALARTQLALQRHVLGQADDACCGVLDGPGIGRRGLEIYRAAYRARLAEAMRDTFGHTAAWLGDEAFDARALAYIEEHPSANRNLRWYGEAFPGWLARRFLETPALAELAAIDWALRRAFDGPDSIALRLEDMAAVEPDDWPAARLVLQPTSARLRLESNAIALWHAIDGGEAAPRAGRLAAPIGLLVWRRGLQPHFRSLGPFEEAALALVAGGATFGVACDALAAQFPSLDISREAGTLLRRWVDDEVLAAIC